MKQVLIRRRLTIVGMAKKSLSTRAPEKGQREELAVLAKAIRAGGAWPIPLWHQVQATEIALGVETALGIAS